MADNARCEHYEVGHCVQAFSFHSGMVRLVTIRLV